MINLNLESLIQRLNAVSRNALEAAAGLCLSRTHYEVEVEHFFPQVCLRERITTFCAFCADSRSTPRGSPRTCRGVWIVSRAATRARRS